MDIFKIVGTIAINNSAAIKTVNDTSKAAKSIATSFNQSSAASRTSLGTIATKAGTVSTQIKAQSASSAAQVKIDSAATATAAGASATKISAHSATTAANVKRHATTTAAHAQSKWAIAAAGIGASMKAASKVGIAAMTAISTAIAGISVVAIGAGSVLAGIGTKAYAKYEQLAGGAKLMFGDAWAFIEQRSKEAYKNVQMSQSDYLQQVNGFAVGLKTALGGNEQAAAELADRIITAEADIVAATGNSQEMVQNAFNGIMKNNFSMVDNLGLGITATKEGFQTMIDSVNAYNKAHGKSTKYQIDNIADCQKALLDYIEMQGMSGYAAAEAAGTIEGSVAMMKATWKDLTVGFAGDSSQLSGLIDNFVSSTKTAASNIIPVFTRSLAGVAQLFTALAPVITTALPQIVATVLPSLITMATTLVTSFVTAILLAAPSLVTAAVSLIEQLVQFLIENLPLLIDSTIEIIFALIDGIVQSLPLLITAAIAIISELAVRLTDPGTLTQLVMSALALLGAICQGIFQNLPMLVQAAVQIITQLVQFLISPDNLTMIIQEAATLVMALVTGLLDAAFQLAIAAAELVGTIIETIVTTDWITVGKNIVSSIADGFKAAWGKFKSWISGEEVTVTGKDDGWADDTDEPDPTRGNSPNLIDGKLLPKHATGLDFVPYDEYPAYLHKGEMVLPANQADYIRSGKLAESNEQVVAVLIKILDALEHQDLSININKREFGRLVKGVT